MGARKVMHQRLAQIMAGTVMPHIFPFLWLHGEEERTLREYMGAIYDCNIRAVCLESRPHPDFLGDGWWHDLDIILDEAEKRDMKVWILDDRHFPTGFANGALRDADPSLCRQFLTQTIVSGSELPKHPTPWMPGRCEGSLCVERIFDDDRILAAVPKGDGRTAVFHLTRNRGPHRIYVNLANAASVRVLLDTVYEPHYVRYGAKFGKTIAGFFSDEPELGNDHLYEYGKLPWELDDLLWSAEIEAALRERWTDSFDRNLSLLWEPEAGCLARVDYMDVLTRCVQHCFSEQVGSWCSAHGVEYIGHMIEDNNQHTRTGSSLGHYFRGLWGQSMAGIDDIGNQVLPQGEWNGRSGVWNDYRDGEFYHYVLGKLASSLASLDPKKHGRAMCEIFGNYGWSEGVRLEKYLVDHFLVRGINRFVPHAFSPKAFPDTDCPPHFYAHGNNPQYRHFGALMAYTGRLCSLFDGGHRDVQAAILYHAEADWADGSLELQKAAMPLWDNQIDFDFVPADAFASGSGYCLPDYSLYIVPGEQYLHPEVRNTLISLQAQGKTIWLWQQSDCRQSPEPLPFSSVGQKDLASRAASIFSNRVTLIPASSRVRVMHYDSAYFLVNESADVYHGRLIFPEEGTPVVYNAWENRLEAMPESVDIFPGKSLCVIFGADGTGEKPLCVPSDREAIRLSHGWRRSQCRAKQYPSFENERMVDLPDFMEREQPAFSGLVRYEKELPLPAGNYLLSISDAGECTEVFLNGDTLGIQIAPPFLYSFCLASQQSIRLRIETASTLERELEPETAASHTGLTGQVELYAL